MPFFSTTLTVGTTAQNVTKNRQGISKVIQAEVIVRSMGTATYVRIGGLESQDRTLRTVGDSVSISSNYPNRYFDILGLQAISDTADAVIEVLGESYVCPMEVI